MNNQKGFSAIHIVILLILVGLGAVGYTYYQKSEEKKLNASSYTNLTNLHTKLNDKMNVAQSTPRIGLGAVLNDLSNIKSEIGTAKVSKCLEPAKVSLTSYAEANLKMMTDFAADKNKDNPSAYTETMLQRTTADAKFTQALDKCKPEV